MLGKALLGCLKALSRFYEGPIEDTLLRLSEGSLKALFRLCYLRHASERGRVDVSDARLHYTNQTSAPAALTNPLCLQHLREASERGRVDVSDARPLRARSFVHLLA